MSYRQLINRARDGDQGAAAALLNDLARCLDAGATVPAELADYHAGWIDEFLGQSEGARWSAPDGWPRVTLETAEQFYSQISTRRRPVAELPGLLGFRQGHPGKGDEHDDALRWLAAWVSHVEGEIHSGRGPKRKPRDGGPHKVAVREVARSAKTSTSKVNEAWSKYKEDAPALAEMWFEKSGE